MWRSPVKRISFKMSCPAADKRKGNELVWHNDLVAAPRRWLLRHKKKPQNGRAVQYCRCFPNPFRCCSPLWPLPNPQVLQRVRWQQSSHLIIRPVNPAVTPEQILRHLFLFTSKRTRLMVYAWIKSQWVLTKSMRFWRQRAQNRQTAGHSDGRPEGKNVRIHPSNLFMSFNQASSVESFRGRTLQMAEFSLEWLQRSGGARSWGTLHIIKTWHLCNPLSGVGNSPRGPRWRWNKETKTRNALRFSSQNTECWVTSTLVTYHIKRLNGSACLGLCV